MTRRMNGRRAATWAVAAIGVAGAVAPSAMATTAVGAQEPVGTCHGRAPTISGTAGDDVLEGTPGADVIIAGDGDDVVRGHGGADLICGGPGRDTLTAGVRAGVYGGYGNDVLRGGRLEGGPGNDDLHVTLAALQSTFRLDAGPDYDQLFLEGGVTPAGSSAGADVGLHFAGPTYTYTVGDGSASAAVPFRGVESVTADLGAPDSAALDVTSTEQDLPFLQVLGVEDLTADLDTQVRTQLRLDIGGHYDVTTGAGNDFVQVVGATGGVVHTGAGFDGVFVQEGPTEIYGGDDNDYLMGGPEADVIYGERGRDFLLGQGGDDRLIGGISFDGVNGGDGTDYCRAEQRVACEE